MFFYDLAFLAYVTEHLDQLNKKLQGANQIVSHMYDHVCAFARKLTMFCSQLEKFDFTHFPSMSILSPASTEAYVSAITDMREEFTRLQDFSTHTSKFYNFVNSFSVSPEDFDAALQMQLIELQCDSKLLHHHSNNDLTFYTNNLPVTRYPPLANHATITLCLFGVTHICVRHSFEK